MAVSFDNVNSRWENIRKNPECNLSLEPQFVDQFVHQKESDLVQAKIEETLMQLADLRLSKGAFASDEPSASGDIVTCEGLEAFLIPAVENAYPLSTFLKKYGNEEAFSSAVLKDVNDLLKTWEDKGFEGKPYLNPDALLRELKPQIRNKTEKLNTTESAAIACRVIVHLFHLHLGNPEEVEFSTQIGEKLDIKRLGDCLQKAVSFLVDAFQKGDDKNNPIGSASFDGEPGSGWSWTDWDNLPPMLFFTAAAVDAFAELELYFIRKGKKKTLDQSLQDIFYELEDQLMEYQFCVDMARRWVLNWVLPAISSGLGVYTESDPNTGNFLPFEDNPKGYDLYKADLDKIEKLDQFPLVFYNNLYALIILLWSFSDIDETGQERNIKNKTMVEKALLQVVNNYTRIDVIRDVLNRFSYVFYLPGKGYFQKEENTPAKSYMDSGFLTLLTRQLVLCGVYGLGDSNILLPLVENLYTELLLNRYREEPEYAFLWSINSKEIFSTQRAVQAMTFYHAYAKGKEYGARDTSGKTGVEPPNENRYAKTIPLQLELKIPNNVNIGSLLNWLTGSLGGGTKKDPPEEGQKPPEPRINANSFAYYLKEIKIKIAQAVNDTQMTFLAAIAQTGDEVLENYHNGNIVYKKASELLNELAALSKSPWAKKDGSPLDKNLEKIKTKYAQLL